MKHLTLCTLCAALVSLLSVSAWGVSPVTGDTSNMPLMIGLLVGAAVLLVVVVIVMKKRKK